MINCILCTKIGKNRKYFFKDKPLCASHYASFLEFLIEGMNEDVTNESAQDAFKKLKISLKPESKSDAKREQERLKKERQKKEQEQKAYSPRFSMGM